MRKKLDVSMILKALDWAYDQALSGIPGFESAEEMAESYQRRGTTPDERATKLVRWQVAKAGTSGFITGLGGILTMPVTIPASLMSVMYVQLRMIAAVAYLGGHDIRSDEVRTLCYACMCGKAATDIAKDAGIKIGAKLTEQAIKKISGEAIKKINQKVGFRLLTKFGEKGIVNLGKMIPLVGGAVGATFDSVGTYTVGRIARKTFTGMHARDVEAND